MWKAREKEVSPMIAESRGVQSVFLLLPSECS